MHLGAGRPETTISWRRAAPIGRLPFRCQAILHGESPSSRGRSPSNTPKPLSVGCCRTWNGKTSNLLRIVLATLVCPCQPSLAGMRGTMSPCDRHGDVKSRGTWDKAMGSWCSIPRDLPSAGCESVGVARQWCGRLGKVDNCQGAIYLGYVSRKGHTLVDQRLFLPKAWTKDTARLDKAGVPQASRAYRTRHQLALELLATNGAWLPQSWIAGDDELGRPYWFRRRRAALGERYLLAVPSNPAMRDLETAPPASSGRGRPGKRPWYSVEAWSQARMRRRGRRSTCAMAVKAPW